MRVSNLSLLAMLLSAVGRPAAGQVLSPTEITDPTIRGLQQSHLADLTEITAAIAGHTFPYHFYFSRSLDVSEREQERSDQRSIQFDRFHGQIVLKITGNYFAAYSAALMTKEERARRTYLDVMLPLLQAAVPVLARAEVPDSFALEISHHVLRKVLGVDTEFAENVVLILPKASAQRLIAARDEAEREAAALEGSAYLNGAPVSSAGLGAECCRIVADATRTGRRHPAPCARMTEWRSEETRSGVSRRARKDGEGSRRAGALRAGRAAVLHPLPRQRVSADPPGHDARGVRLRLTVQAGGAGLRPSCRASHPPRSGVFQRQHRFRRHRLQHDRSPRRSQSRRRRRRFRGIHLSLERSAKL